MKQEATVMANSEIVGGVTDRVRRLRERVLATEPAVDAERALLVTESYKETEGEPMAIRRAKAFSKILGKMTIYIGDDELIVGNQAPKPRMAPVAPEASFEWVIDQMENEPFEERSVDKMLISEDAKTALKGIRSYWLNKTVNDKAIHLLPDETKQVICSSKVFTAHTRADLLFASGFGHVNPNYESIIKKGFNGVRQNARERLDQLGTPSDANSLAKYHFWRSIVMTCDAMITFGKRYAELARELATREKDSQRKTELEKIAEICDWVQGNPARTFWEACQSFWLAHLAMYLETPMSASGPGRFDQYMYPFLKEDLAAGRITRDQAQELVECLWIKMYELQRLRDVDFARRATGYATYQHLVVGGQTRDGGDATNELSYMCLDATAHLRLPQPSIGVRFWRETPEEFWDKAVEIIKLGTGLPSTFYDEAIIPAQLNRGKTVEDARDYCIVGCVEPATQGWEYSRHNQSIGAYFNLAMCLELAFNNGRCILSGEHVGPDAGNLGTFQSFEEVKEAYAKQIAFFVPHLVTVVNATELANQEMLPLPFLSCVVEPCVDRGIDASAGGAKYTFYGINAIGLANVADSLAAIKKLVFDEKEYTVSELFEAVKANWEGNEVLRARIIAKTPHYGNGDPYVDELARWVSQVYCKEVEKYNGPLGGYSPGVFSVTANIPAGEVMGASLDGRKAGEPLADGISPVHGREEKGPTGVFKSAAALDYSRVSNGALLNMKFHPSALKGDEGTAKFVAALKAYRDMGGMQAQFNVVSNETLRKAQQNPKEYGHLLVRVASYSAFFVTLDRKLQEDIIDRSESMF